MREKQRRRLESIHSYSDWLTEASPELNWKFPHLEYIQTKLQEFEEGKIKRLMIFMPPQHAKSSTVTIRFPAYLLEKNPKKRIIITGYSGGLAETFSRQIRNIVRDRNLVEMDEERQAVEEWKTKQGGGLKAVGVEGAITGFSADLIIIDDPVKNREEANSKARREAVWNWFTNDLYTRQQSNTPIILIMTRWHEDDLAGRLLEQDKEETDPDFKWTVVSLPAIGEGNDPADYPVQRKEGEALCEALHPISQLRNFEKVMGTYFSALYQQRPAPAEGDVWKKAWFCEEKDENKPFRMRGNFPSGYKRTQVWDAALDTKERNDFSAMVEGFNDGEGNIYVCAMVNEKMEFPDLIARMRSEMERVDGYVDVCIEDKASGKPARQQLRSLGIPIIEVPSGTIDKRARAKSVSHYAESGFVTFVNLPGNCNNELIHQLLIFDNGRYDDLHDSFVHLLRRVTNVSKGWSEETIKGLVEGVS